METSFLGIIPARGGSKGIPRKNMVMLGDRPLLQYTLQAARESRGLDKVILTSDDAEMIELGRRMGIECPFKRPDYLATDVASSVDVVFHTLDWLKEHQNYEPDAVVLLQPTCPFRTGEDIDDAIKAFESSERECLMSVNPVMQHPCEMVTRSTDGKLVWAIDHPAPGQGGRQVFPTFYFINGAVYIVTLEFLKKNRRFDDPQAAIHIIDSSHGLDIDDPYQLQLARGYLLVS
jgi:CMP-N,N'-diacetyllegionaminic acid synthase